MKIITIIGDSLSMSRSENGITYKTSYAYLLQELLKTDYHIVNKAKRANTIKSQVKRQYLYDDILTTDGRIFIVQLGIVDCSPRLFSNNQQRFLQFISHLFIIRLLIKFKSKYRFFFTKHFPKVYVSPQDFKMNYNYLLETIFCKTNAEKVFIINIADTNLKNKLRSYGFEKNIESYNKILSELNRKYFDRTQIIDLNKITKNNPDYLLEDGIHITANAHREIADKIYNSILKSNDY